MNKLLKKTWKRLSKKPNWWHKLQHSGFHISNFADGESLSSELFRQMGYAPADLLPSNLPTLLHPEDSRVYSQLWERVVLGWEEEFFVEYRIKDRRNDQWCWVQSKGTVLSRTPDGAIAVFAGWDHDITARKETEALLRKQFDDIQKIFDQAESLRVANMLANSNLDPKKTIALVLEQARYIISFQKACIYQWSSGHLQFLESCGGDETKASCGESIPEVSPHLHAVVESRAPEIMDHLELGPYRSWMGIPLIFRQEFLGVLEFWHENEGFFHSEQIWPAMAFGDSISESLFNARKYDAVIKDAQTDALTGLFSRRQLQSEGPELVRQSCQEERSLTLLILDIDHFKQVNDTYGHIVGDAVLFAIAQLCRNMLRQQDLFFRYGGEEFVAFLPDTDEMTAVMVAERLRETVASSEFRGFETKVTISIGIACLERGRSTDYETLLHEADQAMYQAKVTGRNRTMVAVRS